MLKGKKSFVRIIEVEIIGNKLLMAFTVPEKLSELAIYMWGYGKSNCIYFPSIILYIWSFSKVFLRCPLT